MIDRLDRDDRIQPEEPRKYMDDYGYEMTEGYMLPDEMLSCPGCGKHYSKCNYVCRACDECEDCHLERQGQGSPDHNPDYVSGEIMIELIEQGVL